MCGICGFVSWVPDAKDGFNREMLLRMNDAIHRRGPDGEGWMVEGQIGLAMRRLAVIDLDGGQQPIWNEDRSVAIVFNGEIYNYRNLRKTLQQRGHQFRTESDTEVIVHLYEEYGTDAPSHLAGMFAFGIWDRARQRVLLARDRLGIKPLYFAETSEGVLFGSEIKALLASGRIERDLDYQALDEYLTYTNVCVPRSIFKSIRQVEPGTTVSVQIEGTSEAARYWGLPPAAGGEIEPAQSEARWIAECEEALYAAVARHLVSDVPVGAFLSGGLDSGLLVAMAASQSAQPLETFTVGFSDAGPTFLDERKYARALVDRYGLAHHEIQVTPSFSEIVGDIVRAFDEPFADDSVIPSYYVSQAAAAHVKVALTGLGGDELFAGYRRHIGLLYGDRLAWPPARMIAKWAEPLARWLPETMIGGDFIDHARRFLRAVESEPWRRYQDALATMPWNERGRIYRPELAALVDPIATEAVVKNVFEADSVVTNLERALRTDLRGYLVNDVLPLSDRLSMWHSLELRVPYLDHEFVELACRVPRELKIHGSVQKHLLKRIAERWLPRQMIYHRKQGFEAPMGRWLKGPLLPLFDKVVSRERVEEAGLLDYREVARLRDEHVAGLRKNSKILFAAFMLHAWNDVILRGRA